MNKEEMAKKLSLWLQEREVDLVMPMPEDIDDVEGHQVPFLNFEEPAAKDLIPGDILLLSRELSPPDIIRPIYVAYLQDWLDEYILVAPFSPYSVPATDGELTTGSSEIGLRVICPWNSHTVSREAISRSWHVGRLSNEEISDSILVFEHFLRGIPLDERISQKVGPQIFNDNDPRIAYEDEQMGLMAGLVNSWEIEPEEQEDDKLATFPAKNPRRALSLARSGNKRQQSIYLCWEMGLELKIAESSQDKALIFRIGKIPNMFVDSDIIGLVLKIKEPFHHEEIFREGFIELRLGEESKLPVKFHLLDNAGEKLTLVETNDSNHIVPFSSQLLDMVADDAKVSGNTFEYQSADSRIKVLVQGFPSNKEVMFWINSTALSKEEISALKIIVPIEGARVKKISEGIFSCNAINESMPFSLITSENKEIKLTRI